ncbi:neuropeptide FF receptor 1-like [Paramuricea clavata]|uniref:Neuropeptide FF receptor 1-like n=1 Tax=Paramuricea clavata TaxID=317549 RepID=A0A7D9I069_PARCT|nr:neuropeptide FF receptor 1-like [Paramuricea clavata]
MASFELRSWELACYTLILIIGVLGNSTVILVIRKSGSSPKYRFRDVPFNVYLMALAIVDLTLSVICLPVYIMSTSAFPHPTGVGGDIFCKLVTGNLPQFWLAGVSIYILVVISFERYAAITKPFKTRLGTTTKNYVYIGLAWFFGFARELPVLVGIRYTATNATVGTSCYYWPKQLPNIFIFSVLFISQYILPAGIFLVNFYRIKKRLNRLDSTLKTALGDRRQRLKIVKSKARTIRIVFIVLVTFLICWTPNNIMYLLFQYGDVSNVRWSSDYYQFGIILGFSSCCLNPFLYAFQSKEFRSHCRKVFRKIFKRTERRPSQSFASSIQTLIRSRRSDDSHVKTSECFNDIPMD